MTPHPGGVTAPGSGPGQSLPCAICAGPLSHAGPCLEAHPDHCHSCHQLNLRQGLDSREHRLPPPPALTPRDLAAVVAYQRHVEAVVGTGPRADLVTGETP